MTRVRIFLTLLVMLVFALPSHAQTLGPTPHDELAIREIIDTWYAEHRAGPEGHPWSLLAPGGIDASPGYTHIDTGAAVLGPRVYTSLAATALQFTHEITRVVVNPRLARVNVWERGYFYAWAAQRTYERAGSALFILEKQESGRWMVLAHQTSTVGIPPNRRTEPVPDLREVFYATAGRDRDPDADARAAAGR